MTNLTEIFKEILLTQESVTIPGFGTLETSYQPAQLDEKTGTIYPPAKIVTLNTNKQEDKENMLETYLMQNQPVNQTTARLQIEQLIKEIKEKLEKNESVTLDEVGVITKNEKGETVLKSIPNNLMIDNYGMNPVEVEAAKPQARTSKGKVQATKVKKTVTTTTTTVKTASVKDTYPSETEPKEKEKKSSALKWLLILLPIAALITLYILYFNPVNNWVANLFSGSKSKPQTTQTTDQNQNNNVSTPTNNVTELGQTEVVDDPETKILLDAGFSTTPLNIGSQFQKYYLIAGSFTTIKNAQKRQRELPGSKILTVGDQHRVYVGSSDKADDIIAQYNALKKKQPKLEVWLLKNAK